jgi:hypothetical protein
LRRRLEHAMFPPLPVGSEDAALEVSWNLGRRGDTLMPW